MSMADVDSIAQGRVWTGTDAKRIGLVDGLGGLGRAIQSAARIAGLSDYKVVTYPEPTDKLTTMMRRFGANSTSEAMKAAIKEEAGESFEWYQKIQELRQMNGKAMMAMPFVMKTN